MKKILFGLLALLISVPSTWALGKGTCSLTADVLYSNIVNVSNVPNSKASGVGGYLAFDYQFLDWMSLGVGGGLTSYSKNGKKTKVEALDLMGRLILPNCTGALSPYLIGGAGYRPLMKDKKDYWQGHYHAMAGVGTRIDLTGKNPGSGLDVAVVVNVYSPKVDLMKAADLRVGYTFAFGGTGKKAQPKKTVAATPVSNNASAWIPKPFNASKAYAKLKNDLVPARVSANQLDVLNVEIKPFFAKLTETGVKGKEYNDYVAGYFTTLAVELNKKGDTARAQACLDKALKISPDFKDAIDLKARMGTTTGASAVTADAWLPKPFMAATAYAKLKNELVPARVNSNQLDALNVEIKPFFAKLTETGVKGKEYNDYVAGYFTALAAELAKKGDTARAQACLDKALKISPDFKDAIDLKARMGTTTGASAVTADAWLPKPFVAATAYAKLKNELVPARVTENKLDLLNEEVKTFFAKLTETGVKGKEYNDYVAGYMTALAGEFNKRGDTARALACLDKALKTSPSFKEALELKAKMGAASAAPAAASAASAASGNAAPSAWWPMPFDAKTAYAKLKNEIVPARVKANQLADLGKEAKPFFAKLVETGVKGQDLNNYKAGYYAAIGDQLLLQQDVVRAEYYVDNALKIAPTDKEVLAVKAKVEAAK